MKCLNLIIYAIKSNLRHSPIYYFSTKKKKKSNDESSIFFNVKTLKIIKIQIDVY